MSYLLAITIGPVQSYIEESRKLIDLYNSSKIISDIMKEVHRYVLKFNETAKLIYPNNNEELNVDCSNYMIFEIDDIINFHNVEDEIYTKIDDENDYKKTIKETFYLFWEIEKIENNDYSSSYQNLTRMIRSLKNTYDFEQVEQQSQKKCLICGKRNIVTQKLNLKTRRDYKLNDNEELCEVCLFKRTYKRNIEKNIESVYSIAIKNWKQFYKNELQELSRKLEEVFVDVDKYYNPNEINKLVSSSDINKAYKKIESDLKLEISNEVVNDIKDIIDTTYKKIQYPNYEYAFIQFDIDNLGCWIGGKYLKDKSNLKEYQKEISQWLLKFSKELNKVLKDKCKIIYSGGDDFLSILPVENIIEVVKIIDKEFKISVEKKLKKYMTYEEKITYSTSITIISCKDSMSYALNKTRKELNNVKNRYKNKEMTKNGIAISYIVNNGKEITCYMEKEDLETYLCLIDNQVKVKSSLSFSYINNFQNEFKIFNFNDIKFEEMSSLSKVIKYEFKRIILRSRLEKVDGATEEYIENLLQFIERMFIKNAIEISSNHIYVDFINIINILKIYKKLCFDNLRLLEYRKGINNNDI
ncbi:type III-B CRISPR-associated protein Cas10/Cmr2 [Clostridium ihumii]|uniref:type III-B CRISPR-associated protein Cas10/Cmr2 n=1 Tax=Clostridium ihumii TaxID=1470356 RepID=UPI003D339B0B